MSGLNRFSDGRRSGKTPERSNFMQTCNLLSRYIKKKGSFRDFNLEIDGKIESLESLMKSGSAHAASASSSTVNLLNQMDKPAGPSPDSFPRPARPDCSRDLLEDTTKKDINSKDAAMIEPNTSQLTIFYAGRVLVFDSCSADKAKELVNFASKDSPCISGGIVSNILHQNPSPSAVAATTPGSRDGLPPVPSFQTAGFISPNGYKDKTRSEVVGHQKPGGISSNNSKDIPNIGSGDMGLSNRPDARVSLLPEVNGSDLPIARRSSVHRFLEKRKERASASGPYQNQEHAASSSSKGDEHLDLKL